MGMCMLSGATPQLDIGSGRFFQISEVNPPKQTQNVRNYSAFSVPFKVPILRNHGFARFFSPGKH